MKKNNAGFIRFILIIVVAVLILNYLHLDVGGLISKTSNFLKDIWSSYLQVPAMKLYSMLLQYIVNPFLGLIGQVIKK